MARRALRSLAAEDPEDLYYREGESASELLAALVICIEKSCQSGALLSVLHCLLQGALSSGQIWRCSEQCCGRQAG